MMSFPWSYSILGLVPGLILTVFVAAVVLYTSLIIWYVSLYGRIVMSFHIDPSKAFLSASPPCP